MCVRPWQSRSVGPVVCWDQVRRTQRYTPRMGDDEVLLTTNIVSLARHYGRYGYRRITAMLRADGWGVNHKRV
ncbi:MAG: IS3 family transposase, partial [Dehalococcoidia bacterium]|nr:IS3 family transposase [Dehalococcoidia bacterium]